MPSYRQNARYASRGELPKRTLEFLKHGAHQGSRNAELFAAACQFRDAGYSFDESFPRLWDRAAKDGLTEAEARKTIQEAFSRGQRPPAGSQPDKGAQTPTGSGGGPTGSHVSANGQNPAKNDPRTFTGRSGTLPDPIPNGFVRLLETIFEPGEFVALSKAEPTNEPGKTEPGFGQVLKREKWLEAAARGKLAKMFPDDLGVYLRINPMRPGSADDAGVTSLRHVLTEFDLDASGNRIPLETQYQALLDSGLPLSAVIYSGDKSLHGLVRVDAPNRAEYDARRSKIWEIFADSDFDGQNQNPSRYSRAPGFKRTLYDPAGVPRGTSEQTLLALKVGPADWAEWEKGNRTHFPELIFGAQLRLEIVPIPPDIIAGLLAHGEKGQLCGSAKTYKTWTLIDQALAVANGLDWWGMHTKAANVIYLNLELPRAFFEDRLREIARIRAMPIPDNFAVWHLRGMNLGDPNRWDEFIDRLGDYCATLANPFLVTDPVYKLLGGRNENAAGDVGMMLWQLEEMIQQCGGTNFFGHHFAKGDATLKAAIDRSAGSSVFSRDPDSIFVMTAHEKSNCFTVESILRNHEPLESFVVEWKKPLFIRDDSLDPDALKPGPTRTRRGPKPKFAPSILAQWLGKDVLSTAAFKARVMTETGMSKSRFYDLRAEAEDQGLIAWDGQTQTWEAPPINQI